MRPVTPVVAVALAALGFGGLSVRPTAVGPIKRAIASVDLAAAAHVLWKGMESDDDGSLRARMDAVLAGLPVGSAFQGTAGRTVRMEVHEEAAGETVSG